MSIGERWLLLAVFSPLAIAVATIVIIRWQQWRRARSAKAMNRRLNRLK